MDSGEIAKKTLSILKKKVGNQKSTLRSKNSFELLIATVLSAQCTDKRVNIVTVKLFKKYRTPKDFRDAKIEDLENDVRSTGFFRTKAKNIKMIGKILEEGHGGKVPETMEGLILLPGVGRKTANIILGNAFGKNVGIAVDTHVKRLSIRLGLSKAKNPEKIEKDLMELFPKKEWTNLTHYLIHHGRAVCMARVPKCSLCELNKFCRKEGVKKSI